MASEATLEATGGAIGSVISTAATYPLTIVSTWQALEHKKEDPAIRALQKRYGLLPSPFQELFVCGKQRGWRSLYAGLKPMLAATTVSQGLYFYLYSAIRQSVVQYRASQSGALGQKANARTADVGVLGSILVASLAGFGNVLVTNPVWVVSMQVQGLQRENDPRLRSLSAWDVTKQVYKEGGLGGFWKGIWPALVMVINPTLQYILYEQLIARLLAWRRRQAVAAGGGKHTLRAVRLTPRDVFFLSALAKMGATFATYPLLLVKSRLQAMNSATAAEARYAGVWDAVSRIFKEEGVLGFFKGMKIKMIQTVLAAALLMSIKEEVYGVARGLLSQPVAVPVPVPSASTTVATEADGSAGRSEL